MPRYSRAYATSSGITRQITVSTQRRPRLGIRWHIAARVR